MRLGPHGMLERTPQERSMNRLNLTIGIICSTLSVAWADIHYVSPSGHHQSPYTNWTDAATNIQSAIDEASPDDTVLVANGLYRIQSQIIVYADVRVVSVNNASVTTVDGQNLTQCFRVTLGTTPLVDGFTIKGGTSATYGGVFCTAGTVQNCVITGNEGDGVGDSC